MSDEENRVTSARNTAEYLMSMATTVAKASSGLADDMKRAYLVVDDAVRMGCVACHTSRKLKKNGSGDLEPHEQPVEELEKDLAS